jgi:hypothetical protein
MLQFGIRADGFHIEPRWATNVEFGVKILQGIDVQSAIRVLREHLGCVHKLMRYNNLINLNKHGIGP